MGKIVVVYKPIVIELPEDNCKRAGELVNAIEQSHPHILSWDDGLQYGVRDIKGMVALNGPHYDPNAVLLSNNRREIEIMAKVPEVYTICVRRAFTKGLPGTQGIYEVEAHWQTSFAQLKELIRQQTGISKLDQRLTVNGRPMLDSYSLGCQRVFEGCTVTLSVLAVIEHHFKGVSTPIVVVLDESLSTILRRIATILCEDVAKLRFTFSTVSGEVAESAREWLPDRFQLFKAKDAIGSAAENGLLNGDVIRVYQKNLKRKLGD